MPGQAASASGPMMTSDTAAAGLGHEPLVHSTHELENAQNVSRYKALRCTRSMASIAYMARGAGDLVTVPECLKVKE